MSVEYAMRSELCATCIKNDVCMNDKNMFGDTFVAGNPAFFDNGELFKKFKEWEKAGFPCEHYVKEMPKEADYVEMMQECEKMNEIDVAHGKADDILCDLLEELGYKELVMAYGDVEKWYA